MNLAWHAIPVDQAVIELDADISNGLGDEEVSLRTTTYGANKLKEFKRRSTLRMLLDQFTDFMVLVLIAAAVLAGFLGEPEDTIAIVVILALNAILGFTQEYRAQRAMAALKALAEPQARVRRNGQAQSISAESLVPGDIVLLEDGNAIPADLRLIKAKELRIDESTLTGESVPVDKSVTLLEHADLPIADRVNLAFTGTLVTHGRGEGVVVATGMSTQLGRIAQLLQEGEDLKTPLQRRLARFGKRLALVVIALCALIFVVGLLRGEEPLRMLLTALSLAVAAIPEALPAVITVSLALGAKGMAARNALIRRLAAVESLGSVTYICSDKTGTLTQNKMRVEMLFLDGELIEADTKQSLDKQAKSLLSQAMILNSDVYVEGSEVRGDPMEVAFLNAACNAGLNKEGLNASYPRVAELPFDSDRARMTTIHQGKDHLLIFTKGAPERVLEKCTGWDVSEGSGVLNQEVVAAAADQMASDGLRVLAFAYRKMSSMPDILAADVIERELTFLGLVGLIDPPRPEVKEAIVLCHAAGIKVAMITGDHPITAAAIAKKVGIHAEGQTILTGAELAKLDPESLLEHVKEVRVYARVTPQQKIDIVTALQSGGEYVAMTGDGVNDAPALRRADIGVAMGKGGTDVAREAAHMVLLDDNFATIVSAVREGRRIYDNIRKFIRFTLASNSGEIWTLFLAPFLGLPVPLLPIHILWINLVTDGLPGIALALEKEERSVMQRPPRHPSESIFARGLGFHAIWVGLLMGGVCLVTQAWAYHEGSMHWQSMTFTVLALSQMGHVLAIRSERDSLLSIGLWSNPLLIMAVLLTFGLQMATLYVPVFNTIFKTQPLTPAELITCLVLSTIVFLAVETEKFLSRRGEADLRS